VPCLVVLALLLAIAGSAGAATLKVDASGGGAYSSIQAAIDAASSGDSVLVAPGRYQERVRISGLDVYLVSSHGPLATTIDGGGAGPVIHCVSMSENSSIEGFTITGGVTYPPVVGGGIYLAFQASPLISNNIITGNQVFGSVGGVFAPAEESMVGRPMLCDLWDGAYGSGGGIFAYFECRPRVIDNLIKYNSASVMGGGVVFFDHADGRLEGNRIYNNKAGRAGGGVVVDCAAIPIVENNIIAFNEAPSGAGIFIDRIDTDPIVRLNTLYMNSATVGADGIECGGLCGPEISANLIGTVGHGGMLCDPESDAAVTCNVVWDAGSSGLGGDEFDSECFPLGVSYLDGGNAVLEVSFCGALIGDFRPCVKPTLSGCGLIGAISETCPPPGCGRTRGTWGMLKAIYRNP
jgi:hypothetical protein